MLPIYITHLCYKVHVEELDNQALIILSQNTPNLRLEHQIKKTLPRHNGPRVLSPKLESYLKAETNANSNLAL